MRDPVPLELAFDMHGVRLKARVDAPLAQRLRAILGPFEVEASPRADFVLSIHHRTDGFQDVPRHDMEEHWRGTLPDGTAAVCHRGPGARETLLPGLARMRLTERVADIAVAPGAERYLGLGCILPALCECLARHGHYVVHAATLAWCAAGGPPRALLLCGPGGVGKTTAALALAHAGMHLLTDDATFLVARPPGDTGIPPVASDTPKIPVPHRALRVWGLPRPCKVHRRTVDLLPWLRPHCQGKRAVADEFPIELSAIAGSRASEMAEPTLVLLLEERNSQAHRLRPLGKVEAVARLADENVRAADLRGHGPAGNAFRALAALAARTPVYLLSIGPDIETLHDTLMREEEGSVPNGVKIRHFRLKAELRTKS